MNKRFCPLCNKSKKQQLVTGRTLFVVVTDAKHHRACGSWSDQTTEERYRGRKEEMDNLKRSPQNQLLLALHVFLTSYNFTFTFRHHAKLPVQITNPHQSLITHLHCTQINLNIYIKSYIINSISFSIYLFKL